jgi:hypothetical protein
MEVLLAYDRPGSAGRTTMRSVDVIRCSPFVAG